MTQSHIVEYDVLHGEWRCELDGPGNPVLVAKSLSEMEEALDVVENYQREQAQLTSRPPAV